MIKTFFGLVLSMGVFIMFYRGVLATTESELASFLISMPIALVIGCSLGVAIRRLEGK